MSMGISKFGKQKQMKEMRTLNTLLEKFKNPTKADYATIAISLMKNFSIIKQEEDSEGVRNVKYRIADLEIYLYSIDDPEDVGTLNRDCVEGQWYIHRYGVDLAFRTIRSANGELIKFGGVLIRGLEKYENGKHVGNICGCQRCMLEMFNSTSELPRLIEDCALYNIEVYNAKRIESTPLPYRYFKANVDWKMKRKYVFQTQKKVNGKDEYHVWHDTKELPKDMYISMPIVTDDVIKIYPTK